LSRDAAAADVIAVAASRLSLLSFLSAGLRPQLAAAIASRLKTAQH